MWLFQTPCLAQSRLHQPYYGLVDRFTLASGEAQVVALTFPPANMLQRCRAF